MNKSGHSDRDVQSSKDKPDKRKVTGAQTYQIIQILVKSPNVVGGRQEQFGVIVDMITHWEEMAKSEEGRKEERQSEEVG